MKKWWKKNKLLTAGLLLGGLAGFLYWKFEGCKTGECSITSDPLNSTLYGALVGGLLFSLFQNSKNK